VNALPQSAQATLQCRLLPGHSPQALEAQLSQALAGLKVSLRREAAEGDDKTAVPPPLDPRILGPAEQLAARMFPGTPVVPNLLTASTDGKYLSAAGVPTYGVPGILLDRDGNGAHGVNERVRVSSVYKGRDYVYALIRAYAGEVRAPAPPAAAAPR
jgi:acetylornithine deacetylase/succinyl-diaminopimelate desuccinylase-like protein